MFEEAIFHIFRTLCVRGYYFDFQNDPAISTYDDCRDCDDRYRSDDHGCHCGDNNANSQTMIGSIPLPQL